MTGRIKKIKIVATTLFAVAIFVATSLVLLELPINNSINKYTLNGVEVREFKGKSDNAVIITRDFIDNANKLKSLEKSLIKSNISFFTLAGESEDTSILSNTINQILSKNSIEKANSIIIGYGSAGHFSIEPDFMAGIALAPYRIVSNVVKPNHPLLILGVSSDKNATPEMLTHLYNLVSGDSISSTGFAFNSYKNDVALSIISGTGNTYQAFSPDVIKALSQWVNDNTNFPLDVLYVSNQYIKVVLWLILYILVISLFITLTVILKYDYSEKSYSVVNIEVKSSGVFFAVRLFVWLLCLPAMLILGGIAWLFTGGNTSVALIFALYMFGSGASILYLYKKGKMPGILGKLDHKKSIPLKGKVNLWSLFGVILTVLMLWVYYFTGLYGLNITITALISWVFFAFLCFPSFYVYSSEITLLRDINANPYIKYTYILGQYIPLAIIAVASIPIGYSTGFFESIVYILAIISVLALGRLSYCATNNERFSALIQSVIFGGFLSLTIL